MANENHNTADMSFNRRSSVTSAALSNLFRSNSTSNPSTGTPIFPSPITSAALDQNRRRRLSIATTSALGLSGASPASAGAVPGSAGGGGASAPAPGLRRASMSTSSSWSEAVDENAIEEDDGPARATPNSPFARRMSFGAQAMRNIRGPGGASPGASSGRPRSIFSSTAGGGKHQQQPYSSSTTGPHPHPTAVSSSTSTSAPSPRNTSSPFSPPSSSSRTSYYSAHSPRVASDKVFAPVARTTDQGYNWSEQLRSRAESTVAHGQRASFSFGSGSGGSPPRAGLFGAASAGGGVGTGGGVGHDRAKSVSDAAAPVPAAPRPRRESRPKPDHFQERILKGDFYMD